MRLAGAMEAASRRRADPDAADHHRCDDAVRPRAAVRRSRLWAADRARHRVVAWRRRQLLGPQRDDPHACLCRAGGAAGTRRPQAVRRADHEPRLRRGRAAAARRLGGAHGAGRARQLRGGAADADRSRGARPAMVPGQSAARGGAADARPLFDQPAASADRHRLLHHRAAVAAVHPVRHPDRCAGAVRAAGLLSAGQVAVPAMAGGRSGPRDVDVRRHHGVAAGAEATGVRRDPVAPERAARFRRRCVCWPASCSRRWWRD